MLCAQHSGWSQSRVCEAFLFSFFFFWLSQAPVCLSVCACKSTVACVNPPVEPCSQSSSFWNQAWIIKPFHKAALTIYYMRGNRSSSDVRAIVCMGVIGLKKQYTSHVMPHIPSWLWWMTDSRSSFRPISCRYEFRLHLGHPAIPPEIIWRL